MYEELKDEGFTVITVGIERSTDDARPWIEAARPKHPSLIDTEHLVPDLYGMINVPTVVWIDEEGRIARPNDVSFVSKKFKLLPNSGSKQHLRHLRAWVRGSAPALTPSEVRARQDLPTAADQEARAEFTLAWWLSREGHADDAEPHYLRAGELAPHDLTITRGSMRTRGLNPMGLAFFKLIFKRVVTGKSLYRPLQDSP